MSSCLRVRAGFASGFGPLRFGGCPSVYKIRSKLPNYSRYASRTSSRLGLRKTLEEAEAHAQWTLRAYRLSTPISAATRMLGMQPTTSRLDR